MNNLLSKHNIDTYGFTVLNKMMSVSSVTRYFNTLSVSCRCLKTITKTLKKNKLFTRRKYCKPDFLLLLPLNRLRHS